MRLYHNEIIKTFYPEAGNFLDKRNQTASFYDNGNNTMLITNSGSRP